MDHLLAPLDRGRLWRWTHEGLNRMKWEDVGKTYITIWKASCGPLVCPSSSCPRPVCPINVQATGPYRILLKDVGLADVHNSRIGMSKRTGCVMMQVRLSERVSQSLLGLMWALSSRMPDMPDAIVAFFDLPLQAIRQTGTSLVIVCRHHVSGSADE